MSVNCDLLQHPKMTPKVDLTWPRCPTLLKESAEGIATNVLVDRLKKLTSNDIIGFRRNSRDKKIKEYYLTDRGVELYPILYELQLWTIKNVDFNPSENTIKWKKFTETSSEQEVVKHYTDEYKKTRLAEFGF